MPPQILPPSEPHTADHLLPARFRRFIPLLAVAGISIAVVGFISGTRDPITRTRMLPHVIADASGVRNAVNYPELPTAKLGQNGHWQKSLTQLKYDKPAIFDVVVRTDAMKQAALADRAMNRAYDGAPPTIPHPVEAQAVTSCLACHGEGLKVGDRIASRISHAQLTNCTQCHVEQLPGGLPFRPETVESHFVGLYRAGPGTRASPGAPPTIPHHTWMRENCNSCHGLLTRPGLRTTHPWLTNCTQCHAPSATLDQINFSGLSR